MDSKEGDPIDSLLYFFVVHYPRAEEMYFNPFYQVVFIAFHSSKYKGEDFRILSTG